MDEQRVGLIVFPLIPSDILQARQRREEEEAERAEEIARKAAQELDEQIQADAMRQMLAKERQYKARKRANSETTEVPPTFGFGTMMESFQEIDINGIRFDTVKLFHPRPGTFLLEFYAALILMFGSTSWIVVYGGSGGGQHLARQPAGTLRRDV